jgi:hypothetical protein
MFRALGYDGLRRIHVDEGHLRLGVYRGKAFPASQDAPGAAASRRQPVKAHFL